jgi:drug/metabolite transporter (DMT)-like permease
MTLSATKQAYVRAMIWALVWAASFTGAMSLVKTLEHASTSVVVFSRFLTALALTLPVALRTPVEDLKTKRFRLHLANVLLRCAAIWCTYYAYSTLPMAFAASIGFTGPMLSVLFASIFLKEKSGWKQWVALLVGYGGVLLLVNPDDMSLNQSIVVALMANLCASLLQIITRMLSKTDSNTQIMLYTNALSLILISVTLVHETVPPWPEIFILVIIGVCGSLSQYAYIEALRLAEVSYVAPFEYTRLIFALPIGWFFFQEHLGWGQALGCLLISGCSFFLLSTRLGLHMGQYLKRFWR